MKGIDRLDISHRRPGTAGKSEIPAALSIPSRAKRRCATGCRRIGVGVGLSFARPQLPAAGLHLPGESGKTQVTKKGLKISSKPKGSIHNASGVNQTLRQYAHGTLLMSMGRVASRP